MATAQMSPGEALRSHVPAVLRAELSGWALFDGPSGTQAVNGCIDAIGRYLATGSSNRRQVGPFGDNTEAILARARAEVSRFLHADDYTIFFGQNSTSLAFALAHALAGRMARPGKAVVCTELEHCANVDPWARTFSPHGTSTRWIPVDRETLRLDETGILAAFDVHDIALLATTLASNAVGTVVDVARLSHLAHDVGALVVVDGVQGVPHLPVDLAVLDPDVFFWSPYKCYGPHLGVMAIKSELAESIAPFKVAPASNTGPDKFETGTQSHEAIAGLVGTIDALAALVGGEGGTGARDAIAALAAGQDAIAAFVEDELRATHGVNVYRPFAAHGPRTGTVAFRIEGMHPSEIAKRLCESKLLITHGDLYAVALAGRLGIRETGGWARIGIAGYTTVSEAETLVDAVRSLERRPADVNHH
jgi:cysteine desulfurase family protein (TIGR01976 family)